MNKLELLKEMKQSVYWLQTREVYKTSVGEPAYFQGNRLKRQIELLEKEIAQENAMLEEMAMKYDEMSLAGC